MPSVLLLLSLFYDLCMLPILQLDVPYSGLVVAAPKQLFNYVYDNSSTIPLEIFCKVVSGQPLDWTVVSLLQPCT
jgi:hypothetical protein